MKIAKGDLVVVITGNEVGKRGRVLKVLPKEQRAVVEGVRFVKRHRKARQSTQQSGIIEIEAPVHVSNLMVVCPKCDQPSRIRRRPLEDGTRVRVCGRCGEMVTRS